MKNITVRRVDEELSLKLKKLAQKQGKSVNQLVLETLRDRVGLNKAKRFTAEHSDLDHLFGKWSEGEFKAVQSRIDAGRKIDPEIWQ